MPFIATWMIREMIIISEVSQTEKDIIGYHLYVKPKKKKWYKDIIYKTEADSQTSKTNLWLPKGTLWGRDGPGGWDWHVHTIVYRMDGQRGPGV